MKLNWMNQSSHKWEQECSPPSIGTIAETLQCGLTWWTDLAMWLDWSVRSNSISSVDDLTNQSQQWNMYFWDWQWSNVSWLLGKCIPFHENSTHFLSSSELSDPSEASSLVAYLNILYLGNFNAALTSQATYMCRKPIFLIKSHKVSNNLHIHSFS